MSQDNKSLCNNTESYNNTSYLCSNKTTNSSNSSKCTDLKSSNCTISFCESCTTDSLNCSLKSSSCEPCTIDSLNCSSKSSSCETCTTDSLKSTIPFCETTCTLVSCSCESCEKSECENTCSNSISVTFPTKYSCENVSSNSIIDTFEPTSDLYAYNSKKTYSDSISCSDNCEDTCTNTIIYESCTTESECFSDEVVDEPKKYNIFWFGADFTDPGNAGLMMGLEANKINITKGLPNCPDIEEGTGPKARCSNGKVYPQFMGEDMNYKLLLNYDIEELPKDLCNIVSFSMAYAAQSENVKSTNLPGPPQNKYGYNWQVQQYLDLYHESKCYAVPENDAFFYTEVGLVERNMWLKKLTEQMIPNWTNYVKNVLAPDYINQAVKNIKDLYSKGKARRIFFQLMDSEMAKLSPYWNKQLCNLGLVKMNEFDEAFQWAQDMIVKELKEFAERPDIHLDLTMLAMSGMYQKIKNSHCAYGVTEVYPDPSNVPPTINTMVSLGWPVQNFKNVMFFDDVHISEHTHRVVADFTMTWI